MSPRLRDSCRGRSPLGGGGQLSLLLEEMQLNANILMGSVISLEKNRFFFFHFFFLLTLSSNYGKEECCNVSIRGEECPLREKCFFTFTAGA